MSVARVSKPPPSFTEAIFRLSVDQYHDLMRTGVLLDGDPVELLEGVLVQKMSIYPPHVGSVMACQARLLPTLPHGWRYRAEQPIILDDGEPEPDGVIARGSAADNFVYHPTAVDVALVIEVADFTLSRDRGIKLRSYARAGIPVYWIINLIDRCVEVYADPDPAAVPEPTYRRRDVFAGADRLAIPIVGTDVAAADLLPPA